MKSSKGRRPDASGEQDVTRAAMALLVTGEDPESADGRRLTQVVKALQQVTSGVLALKSTFTFLLSLT